MKQYPITRNKDFIKKMGRRIVPRILSWMNVRRALVIIGLARSSSISHDAKMINRSGAIDSRMNGIETGTTPPSLGWEDDDEVTADMLSIRFSFVRSGTCMHTCMHSGVWCCKLLKAKK